MAKGLKPYFRSFVTKAVTLFIGQDARVHRIPFGPIKGRKIYIAFQISPRMYLGIDEPWIAELAQDLIKPGDIVYDIGAHVGYTCLLFAQNLAGTGAVHAFEILPSTAGFLRKTVQASGFDNIVVHNVGLGLDAQVLELPIGATAMTSIDPARHEGKRTELCKVVSLDQYVKENELPAPSLIKMDIERAEIDCLRGGRELINNCKPVMLIEFHSVDLLKEGYHLLESWGYRLTTRRGTIVNMELLETLKSFHQTVFCSPDK